MCDIHCIYVSCVLLLCDVCVYMYILLTYVCVLCVHMCSSYVSVLHTICRYMFSICHIQLHMCKLYAYCAYKLHTYVQCVLQLCVIYQTLHILNIYMLIYFTYMCEIY